MKQPIVWQLFVVALLCQCVTFVRTASIETHTFSSDVELVARKTQYGTQNHPCRRSHAPKCNTGLTCFEGTCIGATERPNRAPCSQDASCHSGYCGVNAKCATPRKAGKTCDRGAQCTSGVCDTTTKKCAKGSHSHPPAATTSATASAALAAATPVSNSEQYNDNTGKRRLLQGPGQVKTTGNVQVVSTNAGPAVQLIATAQQAALVEEVLQQSLSRRQTTTTTSATLTFNYLVTAATGQCSIVPYINGAQLTPYIAVTAAQQSGSASYPYTGSAVSNYAVAVVCSTTSSATVQFDSVAVAVASSSSSTTTTSAATTSSATSTTSTTSVSTTTTTTTTSSSSSATATALPTGDCVGLSNCGFETDGEDYFQRSAPSGDGVLCRYNSDATLVRSGQHSMRCVFTQPNKFAYLQGGGDTHTYVQGGQYVWSFWVKTVDGATIDGTNGVGGLTCIMWSKRGDGAVAYKGKCPVTTAAAVNGFRQVAIPFTAPAADMSFFIAMNGDQGTYAFDDFSMQDGSFAINYATQPDANSGYAFTQTCDAFTNCGWETGYLNAFAITEFGSTICSIATSASDAHSRTDALKCVVPNDGQSNTGGFAARVSSANMQNGKTYTFSFWSKSASFGDITCNIGKGQSNYFGGVIPVVPTTIVGGTNGYRQYATTFTVNEDAPQGIFSCTFTNPDTWFIDDLSLAQQ